jgi:hypothetical protein
MSPPPVPEPVDPDPVVVPVEPEPGAVPVEPGADPVDPVVELEVEPGTVVLPGVLVPFVTGPELNAPVEPLPGVPVEAVVLGDVLVVVVEGELVLASPPLLLLLFEGPHPIAAASAVATPAPTRTRAGRRGRNSSDTGSKKARPNGRRVSRALMGVLPFRETQSAKRGPRRAWPARSRKS